MKCASCNTALFAIEQCTGSTVRMESEEGHGGTGSVIWKNTMPRIGRCICDHCSTKIKEEEEVLIANYNDIPLSDYYLAGTDSRMRMRQRWEAHCDLSEVESSRDESN